MRHLIFVVTGVVLGWLAGRVIDRKQEIVEDGETDAIGSSLIVQTSGNRGVEMPLVHALSPEEASSYWENPPLSGTEEASLFYLGMLALADSTPSMADIVGQMNRATGDVGDTRDLVEAIFEKLASRNADEAMEAAQMLETPSLRAVAMRSVIGEWAAKRPDQALAFLQALPEETVSDYHLLEEAARRMAMNDSRAAMERLEGFPFAKRHHFEVVLSRWLDEDSGAGLEWLRAQDDATFREQLTDQALRSVAAHDSEKAFELALAIPYEVNGRHPAQSMLQDLAALPIEGSLERAVESLQKLPEELVTKDFMQRFAAHAALNSPDKAVEAVEAITVDEREAELRESYMEGVVQQIAYKDPVKASELVSRLGDSESVTNAYEAIIRSWMKSDEFAAAEWLSSLEPSESRDKAIRAFTEELLPIDPERALQWAASITDDRQREEQVQRLRVKMDNRSNQSE